MGRFIGAFNGVLALTLVVAQLEKKRVLPGLRHLGAWLALKRPDPTLLAEFDAPVAASYRPGLVGAAS